MNDQANYPRLYAPSGPAAMILPCVILGPLGMLLFGAGLDAVFKTQQLMGLVYCAGGLLIAGFLAFCLMLHIRAQQVWAWHVRTGRIPCFRKGGFLKGVLVGGGVGLATVMACALLGWKFAEHPVYGELATAAFYLAFLWGSVIVAAPALIVGWARRALDRTATPPN
ncbi:MULTISPECIES: hypothetical protein [Xanthomonas]|nr:MULTISPECIES: hypothetical protein [Xanthomonas]